MTNRAHNRPPRVRRENGGDHTTLNLTDVYMIDLSGAPSADPKRVHEPDQVFAAALTKAEQEQLTPTPPPPRRRMRHPAQVTAERLVEATRLYAGKMTPDEVKAMAAAYGALTRIAQEARSNG